MSPSDRRLLRHLIWVVVLKLLVIIGLWHAFVADHKVPVDAAAAAAHMGNAPAVRAAPKTPDTQQGALP